MRDTEYAVNTVFRARIPVMRSPQEAWQDHLANSGPPKQWDTNGLLHTMNHHNRTCTEMHGASTNVVLSR